MINFVPVQMGVVIPGMPVVFGKAFGKNMITGFVKIGYKIQIIVFFGLQNGFDTADIGHANRAGG